MPRKDMPRAEIEITAGLALALLQDQHPDLATRNIAMVNNGWDNCVFKLGDDLALRIPRRALAAPLIDNEQKWLPVIADRLPLPIPVPIRVGVPALGYPWNWSITPWFDGVSLATDPPIDSFSVARQLADFLKALHQVAPENAPANPWRGIPLRERDAITRAHIEDAADDIDSESVLRLWREIVSLEPWEGVPVWIHGDFHPGNIIASHGEITAVIDFGDITGGDPATDLSIAWMMFNPEMRLFFHDHYGNISDATWQRARGWALAVSVACIANSSDNPTIAKVGFETLERVIASD